MVSLTNINTINQHIEHTLLKPDAAFSAIEQLCNEALKFGFFGVCVPPYYIAKAKAIVNNNCKVITVIGFPMGYSATVAKAEEAKKALDDGADELDMVINLAAAKSADWTTVTNDIDTVLRLTHRQGKKLKVIIESGLLNNDEIIKACEICANLGVDFVKTSTGVNGPGASVAQIQLMRKQLPANIEIKASGGIKNRAFALELINAGANRIGTSSGIKIIEE